MSSEWEEVRDELGRVYYYNKATQETSWTKPLETKGEWKTYSTDDGREYYHNERTGETTWEIPTGFNKSVEEDEKDIVDEANVTESVMDNVKRTSDEPKILSSLDFELEEKETTKNPLIEPPQFKSFQEAEEAFLDLLKVNNVDSTWSFQAVISKFIKNPIYWAIPDALHRKRLYDEYLVQKLKNELSNKTAIVENFEKNFSQVLEDFEKKGYIKYNTRWSTIKNILISEENPIFKNSVLSDDEVSKIFDKYVNRLREAHEESIAQQKAQALGELKSYLTEINPKLVTESEDWEHLHKNLQNDARFRANKHFTVLTKLDILELYITEIYPHIIGKLKTEITSIKKRNYRSDRKARHNFKQFIKNININANSLFEDIFPQLENEDCFIELAGRNGSSPLDLFWDIVDEKYQLMKVKKDLVESTLLGLKSDSNYNYDELLRSKESFIKALADLKDERLSSFDFNISHESQEDNELEIIYDNLRRENDLHNERVKNTLRKELAQKIDEFAHWLALNYSHYDIIKLVSDETDSSQGYAITILLKEDQKIKYTLKEIEKKSLPPLFKTKFEKIEQYKNLDNSIKMANEKGITTIESSLESSIRALVDLLNNKSSDSQEKIAHSRKRQIREDHGESKRFKQDSKGLDTAETSKYNPVLLNY